MPITPIGRAHPGDVEPVRPLPARHLGADGSGKARRPDQARRRFPRPAPRRAATGRPGGRRGDVLPALAARIAERRAGCRPSPVSRSPLARPARFAAFRRGASSAAHRAMVAPGSSAQHQVVAMDQLVGTAIAEALSTVMAPASADPRASSARIVRRYLCRSRPPTDDREALATTEVALRLPRSVGEQAVTRPRRRRALVHDQVHAASSAAQSIACRPGSGDSCAASPSQALLASVIRRSG